MHKLQHNTSEEDKHRAVLVQSLMDASADLVALEKDKIKGAIRTDFILSTEIIVIALGIVQSSTLVVQVGVLSAIAVTMTIGVYGVVACIVKLDDVGLYLSQQGGQSLLSAWQRSAGGLILDAAPWLMKLLTVVGTMAMFLVGGGILTHGVHRVGQWADGMSPVLAVVFNMLLGLIAGATTWAVVRILEVIKSRSA